MRAEELSAPTMTVGALVRWLQQWPDECPVVEGRDITVTDDEGTEWVRPQFRAVMVAKDGVFMDVMPILMLGEVLK
jgi:hypothetical protein